METTYGKFSCFFTEKIIKHRSQKNVILKVYFFVLSIVTADFIKGQSCADLQYTYDLSAALSDTSVTTISQSRFGQCCGAAHNTNCVTFNLTVRPGNKTISLSGSNVTGADQIAVDCGTLYSASNICINANATTVQLTNCKPGNNPEFFVINIRKQGNAGPDIYLRPACTANLTATNSTSPVWTSVYPGATGAYNSYLSCTSCFSPLVTQMGSPAIPANGYIDYQLTSTNCFGVSIFDTARVYFVNAPDVVIAPSIIRVCSGENNQPFRAVVSGGVPPYKYTWSNGATTSSITPTIFGTYTVAVTDQATTCGAITATCVLTGSGTNAATFSYPNSPYCKTASNPFPVFSGGGVAGIFTSGAGLNFLSPYSGQINIATSTPGTYTVTNTITAANGCSGAVATNTVTIMDVAVMTNSNTETICSGSMLSIPLTSNVASSYTWIASDNINTIGESLVTRNTNTINDIITNNSTTTTQMVTYTVTPTPVIGSCGATAQIVTVYVIPSLVLTVTPSTPFLFNGSVQLAATVGGGLPGYVYEWRNSSNVVIGLSDTYTATAVGTYIVAITDQFNVMTCNTFQVVTVNVSPLPIELLFFNALFNGKTVDVTWKTASETNNEYFTVERSEDMINFVAVTANIPSKAIGGNSTAPIYYCFNDNKVEPGINYYRLKQTDFNGEIQYSKNVAVEVTGSGFFSFNIAPNPCDGIEFSSLITADKNKEILIVVYDVLGQEKYSKVIVTEQKGNMIYVMDMSQKLDAGVYMITATSNQKIYSKKMVVN